MRVNWKALVTTTLFVGGIQAYPSSELEKRGLLSNIHSITENTINDGKTTENKAKSGIAGIFDKIKDGIAEDKKQFKSVAQAIIDIVTAVIPTKHLDTPEEVLDMLEDIFSGKKIGNFFDNVIEMMSYDIKPGTLGGDIEGFGDEINSTENENTHEPEEKVFPQSSSEDAPYSKSEKELRAAIQIPSEFEFGKGSKSPVILVPGTGSMGGMAFDSNFAKLLSQTDYADVLWLNIPGFLLDDAQENAEYVAYAINYISGISNNKNVSIISWSQGGLDTQWAFKYWPSTRSKVSNFIPISPNFHGTTMSYILCPAFPKLNCDPSVLQQAYDSNFLATLRADGGDSAYVPTTSVYSGFDEIVQPQSGKNASGIIKDERNVGVSNTEVQEICPGKTAGKFYTHEGVLYNPIAYALAVDALTHDGPGQTSRIDLEKECLKAVPDGLGITDVLATEALIPTALVKLLSYIPKIKDEPAIKSMFCSLSNF